jgi:hypothetical protein
MSRRVYLNLGFDRARTVELETEVERLRAELADRDQRIAAVRAALGRDEHVLDWRSDGYGLQHGFPCRPDLIGCPVNQALIDWAGHPLPGRYRCWLADDGFLVIGGQVPADYDPLNIAGLLAILDDTDDEPDRPGPDWRAIP